MEIPIERPKTLKCPICGGSLHFGNEWYCPTCGFRFQVDRGRVGPPLWGRASELTEEGEPGEMVEFVQYLDNLDRETEQPPGTLLSLYQGADAEKKKAMFEQWKKFKSEGAA